MKPDTWLKSLLAAMFVAGLALAGWALGRGHGYATLEKGRAK